LTNVTDLYHSYLPVTPGPQAVKPGMLSNTHKDSQMERSRADRRINERIDDLLGDSLIQTVMRADHVNPADVRAIWRAAADKLNHNQSAHGKVPPAGGQRPQNQAKTTQRTKPWGAAWRKKLTSYGPTTRSQFCGQE